MRRAVVTSTATAAGILLLLSLKPHGSAAQGRPVISSDTSSPAAASPPASGPSGSSASAAASAPATSATSGTRTVTGNAIDTRYGPVQVRVTVAGSRITKVDVLQYPSESNRDAEINSYALPVLNQEAIAAQSAQVDAVSGATYTSDGYQRSLQSALDQVGR